MFSYRLNNCGGWRKISEYYNINSGTKRNLNQCKERYIYHLLPNLNKLEWSKDEELIWINKNKELGNYWKKIGIYLNNRPDNSIKNKFYCILRKSLRNFNKSYLGNLYKNKIGTIKAITLTKFYCIAHKLQRNETLSNFENSNLEISNVFNSIVNFSLNESFSFEWFKLSYFKYKFSILINKLLEYQNNENKSEIIENSNISKIIENNEINEVKIEIKNSLNNLNNLINFNNLNNLNNFNKFNNINNLNNINNQNNQNNQNLKLNKQNDFINSLIKPEFKKLN